MTFYADDGILAKVPRDPIARGGRHCRRQGLASLRSVTSQFFTSRQAPTAHRRHTMGRFAWGDACRQLRQGAVRAIAALDFDLAAWEKTKVADSWRSRQGCEVQIEWPLRRNL